MTSLRTVGARGQRQQRVCGDRSVERRGRGGGRGHVAARPARWARRAERPRPADSRREDGHGDVTTHQLLVRNCGPQRLMDSMFTCDGPALPRLPILRSGSINTGPMITVMVTITKACMCYIINSTKLLRKYVLSIWPLNVFSVFKRNYKQKSDSQTECRSNRSVTDKASVAS